MAGTMFVQFVILKSVATHVRVAVIKNEMKFEVDKMCRDKDPALYDHFLSLKKECLEEIAILKEKNINLGDLVKHSETGEEGTISFDGVLLLFHSKKNQHIDKRIGREIAWTAKDMILAEEN